MSNLKQRLLSWMHGHVFAGDLIITLVIGVLLFGVTGGITYNPGLLFDLKPSTQMAWEAAMLIPLLIRRWRPQTGALLCVALTLAHLIFGPCLLGADILALFMLYSVIVYGNPKNTKAFIILALSIGLLASALAAWTMSNGPLLTGGKVHTWSSWNGSNPRRYGHGRHSRFHLHRNIHVGSRRHDGAIHAGADADFRSMHYFHRHCSVLAARPSGNRSHDAGTQ